MHRPGSHADGEEGGGARHCQALQRLRELLGHHDSDVLPRAIQASRQLKVCSEAGLAGHPGQGVTPVLSLRSQADIPWTGDSATGAH